MTTNDGLSRYKLTDEDARLLQNFGFLLIARDVDLETIDLKLPAIAALKDQKTVYFWHMRYGGEEYKVYVGKTSSLPRRLREYRNKFQPGVPNDYKLRLFQAWAREKFPGSALDLYAAQRDDNQAVETELWRKTKPLINERANTSSHKLASSHAEYYWAIFEKKLSPHVHQSSRSISGKHTPMRTSNSGSEKLSHDSNHKKIERAMSAHVGKTLETSDIRRLVLSIYPDFSVGSCLPNDHAVGNKGCCPCAGTEHRIFDQVSRGQYFVR